MVWAQKKVYKVFMMSISNFKNPLPEMWFCPILLWYKKS